MISGIRRFSALLKQNKAAASSVGLLLLFSTIGILLFEFTKADVTVSAEGEEVTFSTHAKTVEEALTEQEITVREHDFVDPSLDTPITDSIIIDFKEAQEVTVLTEGEEQTVWTVVDTVAELMEELSITVSEHDHLEPSPQTAISGGLNIAYEEAFPVTLHSDGEEVDVWTTSTTVADLLASSEITLNELDRVEPASEEVLSSEADVRVVRVEKVTDVVEENVDFATVRRNDESLEKGSEEVKQSGENGKIAKYYEVILEDGEEVSREFLREETVAESKDRVVAVGTKEIQPTVSRSASSSGSSESSSNRSSSSSNSSSSSSESSSSSGGGSWQTFTATAYTANCTGCSGITRTGINLKSNPDAKVIAVDPAVIPLGSRVEVKGYGTFLAADTGGAINGRKIDIFMPNHGNATNFGRRSVEVRVLN